MVKEGVLHHTSFWRSNRPSLYPLRPLSPSPAKMDTKRKTLYCFLAAGIILGIPAAAVTATGRVHLASLTGQIMAILCVMTLVASFMGKKPTDNAVRGLSVVACVAISLCDIYFYSSDLETTWPLFVLIVDLILVMRLGDEYALAVVVFVVLWLLLTLCEKLFRFGLYDVPLTDSQSVRHETMSGKFGCTELPCPGGVNSVVTYHLIGILVFVVDFIATRGFSRKVLEEQEAMRGTIRVVQDVARLLSYYDVDNVAALLQANSTLLPEDMHAALKSLEQNLRAYHPYLPATLFGALHASDPTERRRTIAPGLETGSATIAFTDITSSTSLWELAPDAMKRAMSSHNEVIRNTSQLHGGYEVKTIGDAFMIAFDSVTSGVDFALEIQERLLNVSWPEDLTDISFCKYDSHIWGGLTVRVGINSGDVTLEESVLTGRVDYFGMAINTASRLESICPPGAVAITATLYDTIYSESEPPFIASKPMVHILKGLQEAVEVRFLWPKSLERRQYSPLQAKNSKSFVDNASRESPTCPSLMSMRVGTFKRCASFRSVHATVGVVVFSVGMVEQRGANAELEKQLNNAVEDCLFTLNRSNGTLLTLFGSNACVGWNLATSVPSHAESSFRFVNTLKAETSGSGFVSSMVFYGDVGSSRQRFVTVCGQATGLAWTLCALSVKEALPLYIVPEVESYSGLPVALKCVLARTALSVDGCCVHAICGRVKEDGDDGVYEYQSIGRFTESVTMCSSVGQFRTERSSSLLF